MQPYKAKFTTGANDGEIQEVPDASHDRGSVRVQAIFFNDTNPERKLRLFDADGDEFMFPIPGQIEPRIATPEISVLVQLPLQYLDEDPIGGHEVIIFGEYHESVDND
jgi:hypothetical protein